MGSCSGILGFVRLGHGFAIPTPHYITFFCARKTLRVFLIGRKKTSFTTGTLNDMQYMRIKMYTPKHTRIFRNYRVLFINMKIEPKNDLEYEIDIPRQNFTQEAIDLFDIIRQKLIELRIEQNEAKEYFRQIIEKIQEIGFIPPLIINLLRDVDNNYQTLIVSQNLSSEEEKIIAACIKPEIIGSNEIIPQTERKEVILTHKDIVPINDFTALFFGISAEIFKEVINCTQGDEKTAHEFTQKAMNALEKISRVPPLLAMRCPPRISQAVFEQPTLQVNSKGIFAYLQKQKSAIKSFSNNFPIK
jgi:hypothetical protein